MVTTTNYVCSVASPVAYNALAVDDATSTVYTTTQVTVTSCAPTVTGCPANSGGGGYPTSEPSTSSEPPTATTIGCVGNPVTSWKTVTSVCTEKLLTLTICVRSSGPWMMGWKLHDLFSFDVAIRGPDVIQEFNLPGRDGRCF